MTVAVGLVSDTHGVFDPQLTGLLQGVAMILHAGDVGHHGMHAGEPELTHHRGAQAQLARPLVTFSHHSVTHANHLSKRCRSAGKTTGDSPSDSSQVGKALWLALLILHASWQVKACSAPLPTAYGVVIYRGNVDDGASLEELPEMQVLDVNGWHILMTHICGMPPKGGHL
jgi:predicted phosphodiesterase